MTSEIENIRKKLNQYPNVTAVGNAWVICNSKSRPGLKYYFNTFTGQAVWNLSPIEIEKAKKFTKAIPISEIEKCPEPNTEPPMDNQIDSQQNTPMGIVPGQIINNQIPNIFPMNLLNILPSVSGYNSNVWTNPPNNAAPTPQVIYVALPPPVGFQATQEYPQQLPPTHYQNNIFNAQKQYLPNVHLKQSNKLNRGQIKLNRINNNMGRSRFSQNMELDQASNVNNSDLRQKLMRKKSFSNEPDMMKETSYRNVHTSYENIGNQNNTQESPSKYDLSFLKQLKPPHSKASNWFIVVDTEIILNNFPFLNKITDPDQNCYLMVPHHVMSQLEQLSSFGSDVRSRRIYRFLSAQIDSELAFKGDDIMSNDNDAEKTLAMCLELSIQNNVILLTNNFELHNIYKSNMHNVVLLTLEEIKMMLNEPVPRAPPIAKSPTLDIKIVVSNDSRIEPKETYPSSGFQPKSSVIKTVPQATKEKDIYIQPKSPPLSLKQLNAQQAACSGEHLDVQDQRPIISPPAPEPTFEKRLENLSVSNSEKKKEIKLSRNFSNQKTNHKVIPQQIKQFRWRKQRRSNNETPKSSIANERVLNVDDKKVQQTSASVSTSDKLSTVCGVSPKTTSSSRDPSIDRSSVSSVCKKRECSNIIIEETSTSGVISNTTMDCESINSDLKKPISVCDDVNYEVFQIVSQGMEEVLKTRREEWVLRFVQIMEDILREKLRDDSPSQSKDYAPPWAADLLELARCIIKKFSENFNVVDAANKLSFTLQRISDNKGNVSANIEPGQYMDMFSIGVYLIESLKSVTTDCEDLNVAHESLKKLLLDIQNANLDNSHNDPFPDDLNDKVVHTSETEHTNEILQVFPDTESPIKATSENNYIETQSGNSAYILPSQKKTPTKISNKPQQRISTPQRQNSTNAETTFFSSLELLKRWNNNNKPIVKTFDFGDTLNNIEKVDNATHKPLQISPSPYIPSETEEPILKEAMINNNKDVMLCGNINGDNISGDDNENTGSEAKRSCTFVRNFTSIPEYEKTLLNNIYNDYDDHEYADDNYNNYDGFFFSENEEINNQVDLGHSQIAEYEEVKKSGYQKENVAKLENAKVADINNENAPKIDYGTVTELKNNSNNAYLCNQSMDVEITNDPILQEPYNKKSWKDSDIENNKKFRYFIAEFIGDINETFEAVKKLCDESVEELKSSQESSSDMKTKLRAACEAMLEVFNYLNCILDRECKSPEGNIILLLKQANLEDFVPDEDLRKEYTDNISKCSDEAYSCYKTVSLIMKEAGIPKLS